jgi:hypothetical protein
MVLAFFVEPLNPLSSNASSLEASLTSYLRMHAHAHFPPHRPQHLNMSSKDTAASPPAYAGEPLSAAELFRQAHERQSREMRARLRPAFRVTFDNLHPTSASNNYTAIVLVGIDNTIISDMVCWRV